MPHAGEHDSVSAIPTAPQAVTVGGSPYTYTAPSNGMLVIAGGTVSLVQYGRAGTLTTLGLVSGLIPMRVGDTVKTTYAVAPTMTFLPD